MGTLPRQRTRIASLRPITVKNKNKHKFPLRYGLIPDVSETGACVWTDSQLDPGGRLVLRINVAHPADVQGVAARVVWMGRKGGPRCSINPIGGPMWRPGVESVPRLHSAQAGPPETAVGLPSGRSDDDTGTALHLFFWAF
jgi:hypothetical protein